MLVFRQIIKNIASVLAYTLTFGMILVWISTAHVDQVYQAYAQQSVVVVTAINSLLVAIRIGWTSQP